MLFPFAGKKMCARIADRVLKVLSDLLGHENHEVLCSKLWVKEKVERKIQVKTCKKHVYEKEINFVC